MLVCTTLTHINDTRGRRGEAGQTGLYPDHCEKCVLTSPVHMVEDEGVLSV